MVIAGAIVDYTYGQEVMAFIPTNPDIFGIKYKYIIK